VVEPAENSVKRRRWGRWIAGLLLLVALLLAAAWIWRIALVERAARLLLPSAGVGPVAFEVERVDLRGLRIRDIAVPALDATAESVEISYRVGEMFGGRLRTIRIEGLAARLEVGPDGVVVPGMAGGGDGAGIALPGVPADRVVLDGYRLTLDTPRGPAVAAGDAVLSSTGGDMRLVLLATITSDEGRLRAFADLDASPRGDAAFRVGGDWSVAGGWSGIGGRVGGGIEAGIAGGTVENASADMTIDDATAAGVASIGGSATVRYAPDALVADADLRIPAGWLRLRARPAPAERTDFRVAAQLDAAWIAARAATPFRMAGTMGLAARGSAPLDPSAILGEGALAGTLSLDLADIVHPGVGTAGSLDGRIGFAYADGRLSVEAEPGFAAAGIDLDAHLLSALPAELRPILAAPLAVSGPAGEDPGRAPFRAAVTVTAPGAVAMDMAVGLSGPGLAATATGAAAIVPSRGRVAVVAPDLTVRLARAATASGTASGTLRLTDLLARREAVRAGLSADLVIDRPAYAGIAAAEATISMAGDVRLADGVAVFTPAGPLGLSGRGLDLGVARLPGDARLTLTADPGRPLRFDTVTGTFDGAAALAPADFAVTGTPAGRIDARLDRGRFALAGGALQADLSGRLGLPEAGVVLNGLRLSLAGGDAQTVRLDVDRIVAAGTPAPVVPLKLAARATRRGDRVTFDGELFDAGRRLVVSGKGTHRLDTGTGDAGVALNPITFLPTVLQPSNLFPILAGRFSEVDGTVDARGFFRWSRTGMRSGGSVSIAAGTLAVSGADLHGVATEVQFDSLLPPHSAPDQVATVDRIEVGLPFTDGRTVFTVEDGQRLHGRLENLSLFGGTIQTEPFVFDMASPDFTVILRVAGVDLQSFLSFADYGDVQAKGSLRGRLPIVFSNGRASIREGVLETEAPGTLSYVPAGAEALGQANAGTEMLFEALRDFRYEQIRIEITETPEQPLVLRLKLKGASPNVYDGFPLELNVNVGGALRDVLERGLKTYQLPAGVADRLGEAGK